MAKKKKAGISGTVKLDKHGRIVSVINEALASLINIPFKVLPFLYQAGKYKRTQQNPDVYRITVQPYTKGLTFDQRREIVQMIEPEHLGKEFLQLFDAYCKVVGASNLNERKLIYWYKKRRDDFPDESVPTSDQAAADAINSGELLWTRKSKKSVTAHTVSTIRSKMERAGSRLRKTEWPVYLWYRVRTKGNPAETETDSKQATFNAIKSGELPYGKRVKLEGVCEIIDHWRIVHRWEMSLHEREKDQEEWEERGLFRWYKTWLNNNPDGDDMSAFEATLNAIKSGKIQWSRKANLRTILPVVDRMKCIMLRKSK